MAWFQVFFLDGVIEIGQLMGYFEKEIIPRINGYFDITVPMYPYSQFGRHFRMSRETVKVLTRMVGNCPEIPSESNPQPGKLPIPVEKQVPLNLRYLRTNDTSEDIREVFAVARSAAFNVVRRVSNALVDNYRNELTKWPTGAKANEVMNSSEQ